MEEGGRLKVNLFVLLNYKLCWTLVTDFEHTKYFLCSVSIWLLCQQLHVRWPMAVLSLHPHATKHPPFFFSMVHLICACFLVFVELIFEIMQIRSVIFTHTHNFRQNDPTLKANWNLHVFSFNNCFVCCAGSQFCRLCSKMCTFPWDSCVFYD